MTVEERRKKMLKFVQQQREYPESDIAIALLEEIFSITDSWHEMAMQMKRMADAQEETLAMHKKIMAVPVHAEGKA